MAGFKSTLAIVTVSVIVVLVPLQLFIVLPVSKTPQTGSSQVVSNDQSKENHAKALAFEDSENFQDTLRSVYSNREKCKHSHNSLLTVTAFLRGGALRSNETWYGSDLAHVGSSCRFITKSFPPIPDTVKTVLTKRVYLTVFQTAPQCKGLSWNVTMALKCERNNFGMLGHLNVRECIESSVGGRQARRWKESVLPRTHNYTIQKLSRLAAEQKVPYDEVDSLISRVKGLISNFSVDLHSDGYTEKTFREWNSRYSALLAERISDSVGDVGRQGALSIDRNDLRISLEVVALNATRKLNQDLDFKSMTLKHVHLPMIAQFSQSIGQVLPPAPYLVYGRNVLVHKYAVQAQNEVYVSGCGPYFQSIANEARKPQNLLSKNILGTRWADFYQSGKGSDVVRNVVHACVRNKEDITSGSTGNKTCPFRVHEKVFALGQAYCDGYFHFYTEIWPRIGPWIKEIVSDDKIVLHIGCDIKWQANFYELLGVPKSRIIGGETVFAKEVFVPTSGFSHSPVLAFWNILAIRTHVEGRLLTVNRNSSSRYNSFKSSMILVFVRDVGRRLDDHHFSKNYLEELKDGLSTSGYTIVKFAASNHSLMSCIQCQIELVSKASVVIGSHGAGLTHLMWSQPGTIVLEVIRSNGDSSIYAEYAFMLGLKYFPMSKTATANDFIDVINFAAHKK